MPCINPEGKPTETGKKVLQALRDNGLCTVEKVAEVTGVALFRVRSGLRDMIEAELVTMVGDKYDITEKGIKLIE
jgi:predicted transcriptional regulator